MVVGELHQTHTFEFIYTGWLWRAAALFLWAGRYRRLPPPPCHFFDCLNRMNQRKPNWLQRQDLNLRPETYEDPELPGCSTPRYLIMPEVFQTAFSVLCAKHRLTFNPSLTVKALGLTYIRQRQFQLYPI